MSSVAPLLSASGSRIGREPPLRLLIVGSSAVGFNELSCERKHMDTIESRIEAAKKKLKQLTAQKQQVEARKRTEESKRKRTDDTRRKILVGAAILAKVERGEWPESRLLDMMDKVLTRPDERTLFALSQKKSIDLNALDSD
jgi:ferric-dicitrate binding protein FerR (iron transport regulator)